MVCHMLHYATNATNSFASVGKKTLPTHGTARGERPWVGNPFNLPGHSLRSVMAGRFFLNVSSGESFSGSAMRKWVTPASCSRATRGYNRHSYALHNKNETPSGKTHKLLTRRWETEIFPCVRSKRVCLITTHMHRRRGSILPTVFFANLLNRAKLKLKGNGGASSLVKIG